MAHIQQQEFCKNIQTKYPDFFQDKFVLDIGSLDINGNNQEYFDNCNYIGVDIANGRNVDIVSKGHELGFPDQTFDIIISTECFEHDQYYEKTIQNIYRMLKNGGLFIFSCATTGRPEHGTRRTTPEDAPLLQSDIEWSDYYKNLTENDIREVLNIEDKFSIFEFSTNETSYDLYFYGFKQGIYENRNDYSFLLTDKRKNNTLFAQLFIEDINGYSEDNAIIQSIIKQNETQVLEFDLKDKQNIKSLRFDPLNSSCIVEIENIHLILDDNSELDLSLQIDSNAYSSNSKKYFFDLTDPIIYFKDFDFDKINISKFKVELKYHHILKDTNEICLQKIIFDKEHKIQTLNEKLTKIYSSKSWQTICSIRKIIGKLKGDSDSDVSIYK